MDNIYHQYWQQELMYQLASADRCRKRAYICSPFRADTREQREKNLRTARAYMFYANKKMNMNAAAPHAYVALLSPYRQKTETGVNALNELLREKINPPAPDKAEVVHGTRRFRCGDKVMQIKNCDEISNGDIGYIKKICKAGDETTVTIDFGDGRMAEYDTSQLDMLDLGYASTIHKSQGSEYRSVIINLQCAHYVMLTRPLVYTAITRGKENVIIVGERRALCMAIKKTDTEKRGTCLAKRLRAAMQ